MDYVCPYKVIWAGLVLILSHPLGDGGEVRRAEVCEDGTRERKSKEWRSDWRNWRLT